MVNFEKKMVIKEARFLMSSQDVDKCPAPNMPEYAFIGRSNVGKSSLINMLCRVNKLAKTSSTPGKTQLINHFIINNAWYLVDLPGYGYARTSKVNREEFGMMTMKYLAQRENLLCLFILVDARHLPQESDLKFMHKMGEGQLPFAIVFTKADKVKPAVLASNLEKYKARLLEEWESLPTIFVTSSEKEEGRDELLHFIREINDSWAAE